MHNRVTVFTVIPGMYQHYPEFQLCIRMVRKALPEGSSLITHDGPPSSLHELVRENISQAGPYILIVKEPAVMMKSGTVEQLERILERNPGMLCVLPSDMRSLPPRSEPSYHTLRGFERFTQSLADSLGTLVPYDGRAPWMYLVRREALERTGIPQDLLGVPRLLPVEKVSIAQGVYVHPFFDYDRITSRSDVLPLVPEHISSLLDIGCHTGNFGLLVKEKIGCRVVGSEVNPQAAETARMHLDGVIGDFLETHVSERFDCISCLDVVEHIVGIERFLAKVRELLNDNGYLLMSVPNVGHWSIVEDLIAGRWDYIPAGTLCVTHLRFFTRRTIEAALGEAGFSIVKAEAQEAPLPAGIPEIVAFLKRSGADVDEKSLSSLGYYMVAQKTG